MIDTHVGLELKRLISAAKDPLIVKAHGDLALGPTGLSCLPVELAEERGRDHK